LEEKKKIVAKTNRFGALAAVAGASLVAVGLVVIIMLVVEVHPAEAAFPGKNGKMAFSGRQGEEWTIYTINATGGYRFKSPTTRRKTASLLTHPTARRSPRKLLEVARPSSFGGHV
jgi:hypothetical protein